MQPDQLFSIPHRISIRVQPEVFVDVISFVEKKYKEFFPEQVFNWYFLDEIINGKYHQRLVARNQIALFSILAIGIACLGLLGMITNKAVEKTKEIGIRKVLGAQLDQIAQILLNTTAKQVPWQPRRNTGGLLPHTTVPRKIHRTNNTTVVALCTPRCDFGGDHAFNDCLRVVESRQN